MISDAPVCSCITCADQGIEMVVVACDVTTGLAQCSDGDRVIWEVDTGLIDAVTPGERLVVHAGTAIARLSA
jgi:hypothetical protein